VTLRHAALLNNYRLSQNERTIFAGEMHLTMCRMGRWSFCSWFDVNRATVDIDMRQNDFYIFVSSDLDL